MDETNSFFKYLGGRKMGITLIAMLVGGLVEMHSTAGISESFMMLLVGLVGAFVTGNAATTIMALKGQATAAQAETVSAEPTIHPDVISGFNKLAAETDQNKADIAKATSLIENVSKMVVASIKAK